MNMKLGKHPGSQVIVWNAHGITVPKVEHIRNLLRWRYPVAVVVTETHYGKARNFPSFAKEGYKTFHYPGADNRSGGLAILVRNEGVGSEASNNIIRGYNIMESVTADRNAGTTSQWAAVRLQLDSLAFPILLVACYIQPKSHQMVLSTLKQQLEELEDCMVQLANSDDWSAPTVLWTGDHNMHMNETGAEELGMEGKVSMDGGDVPKAESEVISLMEDHGFECLNRKLAKGRPTHRQGGTLDMIWELNTPSRRTVVGSMRVDDADGEQTGLHGSDHYAVIANLDMEIQEAKPRTVLKRWMDKEADEKKQALFTQAIDRDLPLDGSFGSTAEAEEALAALNPMYSFCISSVHAGHFVTSRSYKGQATEVADRLWKSLEAVINSAAGKHIGKAVRQPQAQPGWSEEVRASYKGLVKSEKEYGKAIRMSRPVEEIGAKLASTVDARARYTRLIMREKAARWEKLCANIEIQGEHGRNKVGWSALKRAGSWKDSPTYISAGLRRSDGSLTTTSEESVEILAKAFESQFSEHQDLENEGEKRSSEEDDEEAEEIEQETTEFTRRLNRRSKKENEDKERDKYRMRSELDFPPPVGMTAAAASGEFCLTTNERIKKLLETSSISTAAGPDGITGRLLRWSAGSSGFVHALALLINFCFLFRVLPTEWRKANLFCLPKKGGDLTECGSYRPISVTALLMRRVERLIEEKVKPILDQQLSRWQAGFRKRRSTRQQILLLQHRIAQSTSRDVRMSKVTGTPYPVVFLDISRAFDSVPHEYLLLKLWRAGLRGSLLGYFAAFLSDRRFRVVTHDLIGEWRMVRAGVPQGAVLSPIMYALFINDSIQLPGAAQAFVSDPGGLLYADDIALAPGMLGDARFRHHQLQEVLTELGAWACRWKVRFSAKKSGCVWFGKPSKIKSFAKEMEVARTLPQMKIPYVQKPESINTVVQIPFVQAYQYLGVWLEQSLSPNPQYNHVLAKLRTASSLLRSVIRADGPPGFTVIRSITKMMLLPRVTYGLPFVSFSKRQYARLDSLLYHPMQSVLALPKTVHRAGFAVQVGIPTMEIQKDKETLLMIGSILKLSSDQQVRDRQDQYPVLMATWEHGNQTAINEWDRQISLLPARELAASALLDENDPFVRFALAARRLRVIAALPEESKLSHSASGWSNSVAFSTAVATAALTAQRSLWLLQTRGLDVRYSGVYAGRVSVHNAGSRGALLPPLWGYDQKVGIDEMEEDDAKALRVDVEAIMSLAEMEPIRASDDRQRVGSNRRVELVAASLQHDSRYHAKLRSRLAHNRASFNGVRPGGKMRKGQENPVCKHCSSDQNRTETVRHVLLECDAYRSRRKKLLKRLKEVRETIRNRSQAHPMLRHVLRDEMEINYHLMMGSQCVSALLDVAAYERLLRLTGSFFEFVQSVRPV